MQTVLRKCADQDESIKQLKEKITVLSGSLTSMLSSNATRKYHAHQLAALAFTCV